LHVLPLPLRQQRIERQRALPRPADARNHNEPVPRDVDIDILQIVSPRATDLDGIRHICGYTSRDLNRGSNHRFSDIWYQVASVSRIGD
jgi:hypothetical protein